MPISASQILDSLREDDFAFELRVGKKIRDIPAFSCLHGGTYTDPVTKKPRQFDYLAQLTKQASMLLMAVECKNLSAEMPLVISGLARPKEEAFLELVKSHNGLWMDGNRTVIGQSSTNRRLWDANSLYPPEQFVGKNLFRVKVKKNPPITERVPDSDIYDTWSQAIASATASAALACDRATRSGVACFHTAILPVVVIPDNTLWQVRYDNCGVVQGSPLQVDSCEFFVGRSIELGRVDLLHSFTFSHIHFFTLTGFSSFLSKMAINDLAWNGLFAGKSTA